MYKGADGSEQVILSRTTARIFPVFPWKNKNKVIHLIGQNAKFT